MALLKFEGEDNRSGKLSISAAAGKREVGKGRLHPELQHRENRRAPKWKSGNGVLLWASERQSL